MESRPDLSILDDVETELADVEHALQRLEDGTYGTCEGCGEPIDEARLVAVPAARRCRNHATEHTEHTEHTENQVR